MAKVVRGHYVYKNNNHWYRVLPRRVDGHKEFNYEKFEATPEHFPDPMKENPPKLWVAWIYKELRNEPRWIKNRVYKLFGQDIKPGELQIFKNTSAFNNELWHIKHLLELRPMTFPNGEPKKEDINKIEVTSDGECRIHANALDPNQIKYVDTMKQFSPNYLRWRNNIRDWQCKEVYEDTVYNPKNISIIE